ncbi:hypothetical protein [Pseudomonas citri]|uniref:hypothetical protein n=1 Tax=Pseudomonas citri TaxID=2978349 RepID=UPI0021B4DD72|nr:hypothetical protein [Pseudomonas citri]
MQEVQTVEYKIALLQRYPAGLINDAELEALLKSWPLLANLHRKPASTYHPNETGKNPTQSQLFL